ncbi:hypothetical protein TR631_33735 [Streptomyces rochei]|uniref:hypothetical protein n=1 Tax=Streptomyces rochei TaxID=1928 RepID=UPI002ACDFAD1|nr:hypothetical protein [Streptomyces rochei]WQC16525.1 hypothetical protein TR631_33735 [Streptomyces rochei]
MIPWLILTAVLSGSACWCLGHRTARIRVIFIGATAQQDQAAIAADETARFWQLVDSLDHDHPDDPRSSAA